uniref:Uncharacterized protein n=1 Tax=Physcomitrium patens TaxID=3218 RepID=A0A2K1IQJ5_PHYPA|nr:hypothetical protein PHYPA_025658 [Physcomitrium patens]
MVGGGFSVVHKSAAEVANHWNGIHHGHVPIPNFSKSARLIAELKGHNFAFTNLSHTVNSFRGYI